MAVLQKIKDLLHRDALSYAGNTDVTVRRVALLGGGGAGFIKMAKNSGADLYLTGEVKYHDAQEAFKQGLVVVDGGHFGTESPVVDDLCRRLQAASEERQWGIDCLRYPTSQDMIQYLI